MRPDAVPGATFPDYELQLPHDAADPASHRPG